MIPAAPDREFVRVYRRGEGGVSAGHIPRPVADILLFAFLCSVSANAILYFGFAQPIREQSKRVEQGRSPGEIEGRPCEVLWKGLDSERREQPAKGAGREDRNPAEKVGSDSIEDGPLAVATEGERAHAANAGERKARNQFFEIHKSLPSVPRNSDGRPGACVVPVTARSRNQAGAA